jgi:hypothetical protein
MILITQTPRITIDSQFFGRAQGGALCAQDLRFLSIEIVGIASPRDASTSPMIWLQSIG